MSSLPHAEVITAALRIGLELAERHDLKSVAIMQLAIVRFAMAARTEDGKRIYFCVPSKGKRHEAKT